MGGEREKIKLLIVEDDSDFVYLIRRILSRQEDFEVIGVCKDKAEAVQMSDDGHPDVVLMDLHLGKSSLDGIAVSREIRTASDAKVLILTAYDSPDMVLKAAKEAFASGYLFKNQIYLLPDSIRAAASGYTAQEYLIASAALSCLSEAEMAVFQMMMGKDVPLRSAPKTIANQKTKILKKLRLENQKELRHVFRMFQEDPEKN